MTEFHLNFLAGSIVSCIGLCLATLSPDVPTLIFTMGVIAGVGYGMINLPAKVNCQVPKGQEISKAIFESINFPKFDPKNLKDFCPMYFRAGILQISRVKFWKIDDFKNCFRDLLTFKEKCGILGSTPKINSCQRFLSANET